MPRPRKPSIITHEEERALGRRIKQGDIEAKHQLVGIHHPFVVWLASRYVNCGVSMEELIQSGVLGLLEALERYDPERPTRLLTLAFWTIRRHMIDCIRESTCFSSDGAFRRMARYSLDETVPDGLRHPVSMDSTIVGSDDSHGDQQTLGATLIDPKALDPMDAADGAELATVARGALKRMKMRTKAIIRMKLGINIGKDKKREPMTFVQIGQHFGISAERTRRIYLLAIHRLRGRMQR